MTKRDSGFSLHLVIAAVVGVALLGLIVWRVMDANSSDESQSNNTTSNEQVEEVAEEQNQTTEQQEVVDPNEGYVVIEEWGVRFKPVDGLEGVEYSVPTHPEQYQGDLEDLTFTTGELSNLEPNCSIQDDTPLLGVLSRFGKSEEYNTSFGGTIAEIGDYRYQYVSAQAPCSDKDDNLSLESKTSILIGQSVKSLEAAK